MASNSSLKTLSEDAADVLVDPVSVTEEDDPFSLDFTHPAALARTSEEQPPQSAVRQALELAPREDHPPASQPAVFPLRRLDPLTESAVTAYAAGQPTEARKVLEAALQAETGNETHWLLLFDVYRVMHDQPAFEQLALRYVKTFEKSAPVWPWGGQKPGMPASADRAADGRASVVLSGSLSARCAPQFTQLLTVAKTRALLRLDLGRIQDVDNGGCALLLGVIQALKKTSCELVLAGMAHLRDMLGEAIAAGKAKNETKNDAIWLLLLELHQQLDENEAYEVLALDYALTFEVSPPAWEAPRQKNPGSAKALAARTRMNPEPPDEAVLRFSGELLNIGREAFAALKTLTSVAQSADFTAVTRMDQTSALSLQQVLRELPTDHPGVRLTGCHHLLAALFEMAGVGQLARIVPAHH